MAEAKQPTDSIDVAKTLASRLNSRGQAYALGGAIALGYWSTPRGTMDVDLTLFVDKDRPADCVQLLQELGCELDPSAANASFREHGFARIQFNGVTVDVFIPTIPFYEPAKSRRKQVMLEEQAVFVWDAETLAVFKMMFFREKDLVDLKQILRIQQTQFDRSWVREQLVEIFGRRDPRVAEWDRVVLEIPAE